MTFRAQVEELLDANGWKGKFAIEDLSPTSVRLRLTDPLPAEPSGMVGDYTEAMNSLEQIQYECLRALRTGRTGA
jgi:hypothetical protein